MCLHSMQYLLAKYIMGNCWRRNFKLSWLFGSSLPWKFLAIWNFLKLWLYIIWRHIFEGTGNNNNTILSCWIIRVCLQMHSSLNHWIFDCLKVRTNGLNLNQTHCPEPSHYQPSLVHMTELAKRNPPMQTLILHAQLFQVQVSCLCCLHESVRHLKS